MNVMKEEGGRGGDRKLMVVLGAARGWSRGGVATEVFLKI